MNSTGWKLTLTIERHSHPPLSKPTSKGFGSYGLLPMSETYTTTMDCTSRNTERFLVNTRSVSTISID